MASTRYTKQPTRFIGPEYNGEQIRKILEALDRRVLSWEEAGLTGMLESGSAPSDAGYVTIGNVSELTAERSLAVGSALSLTDAGANSTVTLAIDQDLIEIAALSNVL